MEKQIICIRSISRSHNTLRVSTHSYKKISTPKTFTSRRDVEARCSHSLVPIPQTARKTSAACAHRANSAPAGAKGSHGLLTARTSARPDFPFSRLISRLEGAQLRTRSAVSERPAVAWRVHNGRAVRKPKKRLRRERQALKCAPSTRYPAGQELPSAAFLRAALRTFRPDQEAKSASILRTRSADRRATGDHQHAA